MFYTTDAASNLKLVFEDFLVKLQPKATEFNLLHSSILRLSALYLAVAFFTSLFLVSGTGYIPPLPESIHASFNYTLVIEKPWMIPVITGLGGLLVGIITTRFSPESEGHGTDAVIDAYHHRGGRIRARVPLIKGIASAITLGSGGSGEQKDLPDK